MVVSVKHQGIAQPIPTRPAKRRHVRVQPEPQRPIRVDLNGSNFIEVLSAADISESGLGLYVPHQFENCQIDQELSFVLTLPEPVKRGLTLTGKIKHVSLHTFGIEFTALTAENRRAIRHYIGHRLKDQSIITRIRFWLGLI